MALPLMQICAIDSRGDHPDQHFFLAGPGHLRFIDFNTSVPPNLSALLLACFKHSRRKFGPDEVGDAMRGCVATYWRCP